MRAAFRASTTAARTVGPTAARPVRRVLPTEAPVASRASTTVARMVGLTVARTAVLTAAPTTVPAVALAATAEPMVAPTAALASE